MAAWRPLPGTTAVEVRHLVTELRRLKDAGAMSLAALAAKTAYSKSSWERYLNARKLAPRHAVEELSRLAGEDPTRLLALWELAERVWSRRNTCSPGPAAASPGDRTSPKARRDPAVGSGRGESTAGGGDGAGGRRGTRGIEDTGSAGKGRPATPARAGSGSGAPGPSEAEGAVTGAPHAVDGPEPEERGRPFRLTAVVAVALLVGAVVVCALLAAQGGERERTPATEAVAPAVTGRASIGCHGTACDGKDPRSTGCAADAWTVAVAHLREAYIEVRYSGECRAAWGRIVRGSTGDSVEILPDSGPRYRSIVGAAPTARTLMVSARTPGDVRVCGTLGSSRERGCSRHGGSRRLPEPPTRPEAATGTVDRRGGSR